jgi:Tfp pilus assembly protein PilX
MEPRLHRMRASEDGNVLIIVIVMMVVLGLIVAATFANAGANFRNTAGVRANDGKLYAADAGIEWATRMIRSDGTLCPTVGAYEGSAPGAIPDGPEVNGQTPSFKCTVTEGSSTGGSGYAVITTSTAGDSLATPSGPQNLKTINGPVWASDIENSISDVSVTNGDVYEDQSQGCTTKPAGLTIAPPFGYLCTSQSNPAPLVPHALPTSGLDSAAPRPADGDGDIVCRVFRPGRYTSPIQLGTDNYFVSGVYYFDNIGLTEVRQLQLVGGEPATDETRHPDITPCTTDAAQGGASGTGVKIILGGNSRITVSNPSGRLELFSRSEVPNEGTPGISIQTVCSSSATFPGAFCAGGPGASWRPSTLTLSDALFDDGNNGDTVRMSIHGLVYAPNTSIPFNATNGANAWLLGGVVVGKLTLRQQANLDAVRVSTETGPGFRTLILESTVKLTNERRVRSIAKFKVSNDTARTLTPIYWRTECQDPSGNPCKNV